jgi:hypothetical protein
MSHREGNVLKDQAYYETIGASPLNPVECDIFVYEAFQCGTVAHMLKECQTRLRRNELARLYHHKRLNLLAPLNLYKRQF